MTAPEPGRFVLALTAEGASDDALRAAAELAGWLRAGLHALLLEEEQAMGAARLGFGVTIGGGAARRLDAAAMEAGFDRLARALERRVEAVARAARLPSRFERRRGEPASTLLAALAAGDVVAVFEPAGPGERSIGAHPLVRRAALGCVASTLLLPRRTAARPPARRQADAIAVVATTQDAATLDFADRLARAAHARLERLEPDAAGPALRHAPRLLVLSAEIAAQPSADPLIRLATRLGAPVLTLAAKPHPARKDA